MKVFKFGGASVNSADAVRRRSVPKDWAYLAGFACPDYASAVGESGGAEETASGGAIVLPLLGFGSRGESVRAMQGILIARGFGCALFIFPKSAEQK